MTWHDAVVFITVSLMRLSVVLAETVQGPERDCPSLIAHSLSIHEIDGFHIRVTYVFGAPQSDHRLHALKLLAYTWIGVTGFGISKGYCCH